MEGYKVSELLGMMAEPLWAAEQLTEKGKDPSKRDSWPRVSSGSPVDVIGRSPTGSRGDKLAAAGLDYVSSFNLTAEGS